MVNITKTAHTVSKTLPKNLKHFKEFHDRNIKNVRLPIVAKTSPATKAGVIISLISSAVAVITVVAVSAHSLKYFKDREYRHKVDDAAEKAHYKQEEVKEALTKKIDEAKEVVKNKTDEVKEDIQQKTEDIADKTKTVADDAAEKTKP